MEFLPGMELEKILEKAVLQEHLLQWNSSYKYKKANNYHHRSCWNAFRGLKCANALSSKGD